MTTLDKDLKEPREEMKHHSRSRDADDRIMKKGEINFNDIPAEEEVKERLKDRDKSQQRGRRPLFSSLIGATHSVGEVTPLRFS